MLKNIIRKIIKILGLKQEYVKYLKPYKWYLKIKAPEQCKLMHSEKTFYSSFLKGSSLIFDVGANVGNKAFIFLKCSKKTIIVEPDKNCLEILKFRFSKNKKAVIVNKAVSDKNETVTFYSEGPGSAYNTLSEKWKSVLESEQFSRVGKHEFHESYLVETVTLDTLISIYGVPHYIKIDVEGYEKQALLNLFTPVPWISFECNLPEFKTETIDILKYIHQLDKKYNFNYIQAEYKFQLKNFIPFEEFVKIIEGDSIRYMEIYARKN